MYGPHRAVISAAGHLFAVPDLRGFVVAVICRARPRPAPLARRVRPHRPPAMGLFAADRVERRVYTGAVRHPCHVFDHVPGGVVYCVVPNAIS
jgi:hypothetical protein